MRRFGSFNVWKHDLNDVQQCLAGSFCSGWLETRHAAGLTPQVPRVGVEDPGQSDGTICLRCLNGSELAMVGRSAFHLGDRRKHVPPLPADLYATTGSQPYPDRRDPRLFWRGHDLCPYSRGVSVRSCRPPSNDPRLLGHRHFRHRSHGVCVYSAGLYRWRLALRPDGFCRLPQVLRAMSFRISCARASRRSRVRGWPSATSLAEAR